jgi:hypothetical protein
MKYKIGYIDEDPRQVAKYERDLREYFDVIGYNISKGLTLKKLIQQVYSSDIDLLMVDFLMVSKGILTYNGDKVAKEYKKIKPLFPVLIFTNRQDDAFHSVDNPNIIYEKEEVKKDISHFVETVEKNILFYKNYIEDRQKTIEVLISKGDKIGLNATEKHELIIAQQELTNLDKLAIEVPSQLLEEKRIEELSKTTKEAEKFLNSLIKQSRK